MGRPVDVGASTERPGPGQAVANIPAGLTHALGKQRHWDRSDEDKPFLKRTWPRICDHKLTCSFHKP